MAKKTPPETSETSATSETSETSETPVKGTSKSTTAQDAATDTKKETGSEQPSERTSWCIEADQVDGLQVKLYNFGAASLAKKAIQWWKKGKLSIDNFF